MRGVPDARCIACGVNLLDGASCDVADAGGCIAARIGEGRCDACGTVFSCVAGVAAEWVDLRKREAI